MTYLIINDGYTYQELTLEIEDILNIIPQDGVYDISDIYSFSMKNISFKQWWKPVKTDFTPIGGDKKAAIPDISLWIGATLVLSSKAHHALRELLMPHGELLPVDCTGKDFYIFNCLELAQANELQSEKILSEGQVVGIKKLVFDSDAIAGKAAFKSKYAGCQDVFCNQTLKNAILENKLNGVVFSKTLIREF